MYKKLCQINYLCVPLIHNILVQNLYQLLYEDRNH